MDNDEFSKITGPIALVVDDEPLILMDASDIISEAGYHVIEAATADQAFEFLRQHSALELLFTDVQTPGSMDGFDLAKQVAKRWSHIMIIVVSGAGMPKPGELPARASFISKPYSAEVVAKVLEERFPNDRSKLDDHGAPSRRGGHSSLPIGVIDD